MKELSIEQKARRYDEILARAEGANLPYYKEDIMSKVKEFVDYLIPELKESEDERIRKELLEHCKNQAKPYIQTGNKCPQIQSWIAWLEKQRDKDKLIKELGEYKVKYTQEVLSRQLEKQGEQESVVAIPKFREGDSIQFKGFGHNRYMIKEVCGLSHYINTMGNRMDMSYTDANFEVIKDSDKVKLSPVWSEEDIMRIDNLIAIIENRGYPDYVEYLEKLKYRVQWKPTEEQMGVIEAVINNRSFQRRHLDSLYADLKKLKEE